METIRNYLEAMFRKLPQTDAVIKAKYELAQMMEDKYTELIREGKSENEAVGIVISEFGNLEDLAADLGIDDVYKTNKVNKVNRRKLSLEEITGFLDAQKKRAYFIAAGVACFICCVTGPIFVGAFNGSGNLGATLLFLILAVGLSLCIISKNFTEEYNFINSEACEVDQMCLDFLKNKNRDFSSTYSIMTSTGILLCVLCIVPPILLGDSSSDVLEDLSGAFLFFFVAAGVFLLIVAKKIKASYERLLKVNDDMMYWNFDVNNMNSENENNTSSTSSVPTGKRKYKSTTGKTIMECYWPTATCIYLTWSFLTYDWYITWIIWPIAAVLSIVFKNIFTEVDE